MLEIVFTNGKIGAGAVKLIGICEKARIPFGVFNDEEAALLRQAIRQKGFAGKVGTTVEAITPKGRIVAVGLGKNPGAADFQLAGASLLPLLTKDSEAIFLTESLKPCKTDRQDAVCRIAFGMQIGAYRFDKYFSRKAEKDFPRLERVLFKIKDAAGAAERYRNAAALANAVRYARDLANEPANYLTPEVFAADIKRLKYLGLEIEILDRKQLREKGFGLLLAVAQGSVQEPKVAVIKWKGNPDSDKWDAGLVGKGVTFDSGGISLKPGAGMEDMKQDMTGAAVVAASLKALALQCSRKNVVGIVGLVENMPSGSATRPGDVVTSMSGQTVEIINTDAEGRLVLGDCLWYLQQAFGVGRIIDIATLTGATMRALGDQYAGLFCNNDKLADDLLKAGEESGERLWRLPVNENYNKQLDSDIADMKNIGGALAGGSTAACFLQRFIRKGVRWAHLDIAGVDKENKGSPLCPKGATGWGVRLLNAYLSK